MAVHAEYPGCGCVVTARGVDPLFRSSYDCRAPAGRAGPTGGRATFDGREFLGNHDRR